MASIGNDATEAQQVREYYREREKVLKEEHRKEIAKMQEAHQENVQEVNANNDDRINRASLNTQATIERRDLRHQNEIAKIQKAHTEQKRRESADRMKNENRLNDSYQERIRRQEQLHKAQLKNVQENSRQTLDNNNTQSSETISNYQQNAKFENEVSRNRLNRIHQEEKREQSIRHRNEMDDLRFKNEGYKQSKQQEISQLKRKHQYEIEALNRKHEIAFEDERYNNAQTTKGIQDEYNLGITKIQKRYNDSLKREKQELSEAREKMYSQEGRVGRDRDRQNQKIRNLREDNTRNMARADAQKRRELDNLRYADKFAYDKLIDERRGMVKEFNRIHSDEMVTSQKNADQRIQANENYNRKKVESLNDEYKAKLTDQRRKLITENNDKRKANELHLDQLQENYSNDREKLLLSHKGEKERMGQRYQQNLEKNRFKGETERARLQASFEDKVRDLDQKHKLEQMNMKREHDKKIIAMKDQQQQKLISQKKESERVQLERERAYKMRETHREAKFEHRLKNMEEQHKDQMQQMDNRYRHNLSELIREGQLVRKRQV